MSLVARIPVPIEADNTVRKVVLSDRYLVTATVSGWVTALDLRALEGESNPGQPQRQVTFQADRLWDLDCRDNTIAIAHEKGTVTLWDAQTGVRKVDLDGHVNLVKCIVMPPNRQTVASGSRDTSIIIWDAQTYLRRATLTGHRERIMMLQVFDDFLVSGSHDGAVRVWDMNTNSCVHNLIGHNTTVMHCGMNDDRTLLATGDTKGIVKIWNMKDGALVADCHGHTTIPIQFSNAPGNVLITAAANHDIRSWDWTTGHPVRKLDAQTGGRGFVWTEKSMIAGGENGVLQVYDRESWEFQHNLREAVETVYHVVKRANLFAVALLLHDHSSLVELWDLTKLDERLKETPESGSVV